MRRVVAVQPGGDAAFFVQQQNGRRELHLQPLRQNLFRRPAAVYPGHLPIAPDIERDRDVVLTGEGDDVLLAETGLRQFAAVRAAGLGEINQHPLAGVTHLVVKFQEGLREPGRVFDFLRLPGCVSRGVQEQRKHGQKNQAPHDEG